MSPDVEHTHHVDVRPEAIQSIRVQQFQRCPAHDVDARIHQDERWRIRSYGIRRALSDAEDAHRGSESRVRGAFAERMPAPGLETGGDGWINLFGKRWRVCLGLFREVRGWRMRSALDLLVGRG